MTETTNLGLPYIAASQAQKHVTHNEALRILDAAVQPTVQDTTRTAPPASPVDGQRHIVAGSPSGAWAGHAKAIASWQDGAWAFLMPKAGWCVWSIADDVIFVYDGTAWRDQRDLAVANIPRLGVNTTATTPNLLSVKSNAALFAAINASDGGTGDVRLQLSKESAAKTASVVFADNYSGRAEFGLVGDDEFRLKVSANGTTWFDAIRIDRATGKVAFPASGGPRDVLTANRTYYVRTDGSDGNNGLANTTGGAFATPQRAYDMICATLDLAGYTATIQLANGTYTGGVVLGTGWTGGGTVAFLGDTTTPANVVFSRASGNLFTLAAPIAGTVSIRGLKLTAAAGVGIYVGSSGVLVSFDRLDFGACSAGQMQVAAPGSLIKGVVGGSYGVSGGSVFHMQAVIGGQIQVTGMSVTLTGTPAFGYAFADAESGGILQANFVTYTGSATGTRYIAASGGIINSGGGGASYFPGSAAGVGSNFSASPYGLYG